MDNKKATIRQGGEVPLHRARRGRAAITELKDIDLVLEVTPRIAFDGSVNMEVSVKCATARLHNQPALETRRSRRARPCT
jgi:type II secretory pathway component HofQ